jgi:hypothetical protein
MMKDSIGHTPVLNYNFLVFAISSVVVSMCLNVLYIQQDLKVL